ncbi:MAG: UDP-N-acetylmuramoyl-L-alanyl-D-glutamate--2,6-diaminopimelate ligase, partial [Planctomycetes bacterium]|nr:UDP-N-acetylmuramoyl-L-alanyl-D-glutamate--2,6-diaminopimelate ligase [Planctomycetota bacterium]
MPSAPTPTRRPLLQLLRDANVEFTCTKPLDSVWVAGLSDDSRRVEKESLFVAVDGTADDGHRFIAQAIDSGASAAVLSDPSSIDERVPNIIVANTRLTLAKLAATHSGLTALQANGDLHVIAVTGTNGKSTTGHLVRNILREAGHSTALLGTIEYDLVGRQLDAPWTTPPPIQLVQFLVEAHRHGAQYAVMEVSS